MAARPVGRPSPDRLALVAAGVALCLAAPALAQEQPPVWMLTASGGTISRDGDGTHADGTVAVTRKLGRGYVRASVVRFGASTTQGGDELPSTYTIGFLSGGAVFGRWFADGYIAGGVQHYGDLRTPFGRRPVSGAQSSGVLAGGVDGGYVVWLGRTWSLTPSASVQYVRSRALREQFGPDGPSEYETRETGTTVGATLRLDRWLGANRQHDLGLHVSALDASNASAALVSQSGASSLTTDARAGDRWIEAGANGSLLVSRRLYLDVAAARTVGVRSGDVTTTSLGVRFLF